MSTQKLFINFLLLIFLNLSQSVFAETIYVQDIKAKGGVKSGTLETIKELVSSGVVSEGHELMTEAGTAEFILQPKLLKLGDSYILKIDKIQNGKIKFSSKMKASSLSDMDTVAVRVVRSVMEETLPRDSAQVNDVTEDEVHQGTRRYQATRQWRFSFGPAWSNGLNVDGGGTNWGFGYVWGLDPDFDLKLNWSIYTPRSDEDDNARFTNVTLGMNYFLTRAKHSPFASIEIGYGSAAASEDSNNFFGISDDDASGWTIGLGLGYKFFRTSTVNVGIFGSYQYMFDKTEKSNQTPRLGSVSLVVYY
ncbi:MAG: hypothetical protein KDD58_12830 [Bdellovibrionales bacterium]|nr:hypothetical protein [Bdellovibrionales bacterium]